jgi:hypothetical protein
LVGFNQNPAAFKGVYGATCRLDAGKICNGPKNVRLQKTLGHEARDTSVREKKLAIGRNPSTAGVHRTNAVIHGNQLDDLGLQREAEQWSDPNLPSGINAICQNAWPENSHMALMAMVPVLGEAPFRARPVTVNGRQQWLAPGNVSTTGRTLMKSLHFTLSHGSSQTLILSGTGAGAQKSAASFW